MDVAILPILPHQIHIRKMSSTVKTFEGLKPATIVRKKLQKKKLHPQGLLPEAPNSLLVGLEKENTESGNSVLTLRYSGPLVKDFVARLSPEPGYLDHESSSTIPSLICSFCGFKTPTTSDLTNTSLDIVLAWQP